MNRLSPAHTCLGEFTTSINDMPTLLHVADGLPSTWLVDLSPLHRWLLRGGEVSAWLSAHDIPIPEQFFRVQDTADDSFVVRTGFMEFFLHDGPGGSLQARLGDIPSNLVSGMRIFERDDLEIALGGTGAGRLISEFCALDLSNVERQFLLTRVAGVTAWVRVEGKGEQRCYRIGCDPSYGAYLFETLLEGVHECGGGLIGYADFYDSRGTQNDAS